MKIDLPSREYMKQFMPKVRARIPDKPVKEPKREKPVALPKNNTKLSEAKQKMIWKLHTAGRSTREVAALVGCCHASVYKYTVNGKRQWRRTSDEDRKEIIRLRSEGVTYTALAKKFKRSLQTVWGIVNGRLK
jgi:IS30 family transposase